MQQRHLRRGEEERAYGVDGDGHGQRGAHAYGDAQIAFPGFLAEFAAANFHRFLPAEIARLVLGDDFLWKGLRVHGFQFLQRITSFSRSIPKLVFTRPRTSSIRPIMSSQEAWPAFTKKLAWRSLTMASPT